jgi:hypothetical protein
MNKNKIIDCNELLEIRNKLYNEWVQAYENLTIKNRNDPNKRTKYKKLIIIYLGI